MTRCRRGSKEARIRAQGYWYRDGLDEIFVGIIMLLQNGFTLVMRMANSRSSWYLPVILIYLLLILVFAVRGPRLRAAMNERITYPRGGFMRARLSGWQRSVVAIVVALILTVAGVLAIRYASRADGRDLARWFHLMPAVGGLVFGAALIYISVRQGLPRFLVVGVLSILLGVAVCIEYPPRLATAIWLVGLACALLCSGGITLWNYLRTAPLAAEQT